MRLNIKAFALTSGLLMGLGLFFITWWIIAFEGATGEPTVIAKVYRGYEISPAGSFIGLAWGFADWFLGGLIFAWLYNKLLPKKPAQTVEMSGETKEVGEINP